MTRIFPSCVYIHHNITKYQTFARHKHYKNEEIDRQDNLACTKIIAHEITRRNTEKTSTKVTTSESSRRHLGFRM